MTAGDVTLGDGLALHYETWPGRRVRRVAGATGLSGWGGLGSVQVPNVRTARRPGILVEQAGKLPASCVGWIAVIADDS